MAGALHALAARMKRDGRVRAEGRTRPTGVESHDAPILAPPFFGVCITPPPRAQRARLSSGWHSGRKSKSDRTASHLLSPSERRDKRGGSAVHLAGDSFRCPLSRWDKRAGSAGQLARNLFPRPLLSHRESRDQGGRGAAFAPGFTLIEIAVVLFLMGLMFLIAMPYIGGVTDGQLKSVSRRLAGRATYLYDEASARKLVIQLVFDMDHNGYYVMVADPYSPQPTFFPDHSPSGARVLLPDAVHIRDVTVEGIGTLSRGTLATQFYPEGYVDATLIHLIDQKGRVMTLRIDPLTGRVAIARGDLRGSGG